MKIINAKDYADLSKKAASILAAQIIHKPNCVLGLATGSTPVGAYQELVRQYQAGKLDFSEVTTYNLDEYIGLTPENEQSYHYFMQKNLFDHVNLQAGCCHVPDGCADDPNAFCATYDEDIYRAGGIDLQLLGIGQNGHIAFNEPADTFIGDTHLVDLKQNTIDANKRFFASADDVPRRAITMGIRSIFQAKKILLLAHGVSKKDALEKALFGPICPQVPASILQLHPNLTVICHVEDNN